MTAPYSLRDLTVNICTVGRNEMLRRSLESLLELEPAGPTLQLVINASPGTRAAIQDLLDRWPTPPRIVELSERVPIAEVHQIALDSCTTQLINFMGDDDRCLSPRFARAVEMFNSTPDLQIVGSWVHRMGGDLDDPKFSGKMDLGPRSVAEWEEFRRDGRIVQFCFPASIYRAAGLRDVGGCERRWSTAFDVAMTARLATLGPAVALTDRPFGFRIHNGSVSSESFEEAHRRIGYVYRCQELFEEGETEPTYEDYLASLSHRPALERWIDRKTMLSRRQFRRAGSFWLDGKRFAAAGAASLSLLHWPPAFWKKLQDQRGEALGDEQPPPERSGASVDPASLSTSAGRSPRQSTRNC